MSVITSRPVARMPIARSLVRAPKFDWVLMGATAAIVVIGTLLVWSSTATNEALTGGASAAYLRKHLINIVIGVLLMLGVMLIDHRRVRLLAPLLYLGSIVGLLLVLLMGSTINGSRSWLLIGGMSIQPSEFAKLAVVVGMALIVAERTESAGGRRVNGVDVALMLALAGVPAMLIMLQPDLGTMLVLSATVLGVVAVSGAPRRYLVGLVSAAVATSVAAVTLGVLKPYQLDRFLAFIDPGLDPRGAGYNTTQARIAIGNGGFTGQGLFNGSQTRSGFVPEQHTDFIFTVAGEELGLIGAGLLIGLFLLLLWRALLISLDAPDMFGRLAAAGICCWLAFQAFQNLSLIHI